MNPIGGFGSTLESARSTEFFAWFSLAEIARSANQFYQTVVFAPEGAAFRDLVRFETDVEPSGALRALRLRVKLAFVHDPRQAPFAGDIAASFVRTCSSPADASVLAGLLARMTYPQHTDPPLLTSRVPPAVGTGGERAYEAFLGEGPPYEHRLAATILRIVRDGDDALLAVTQAPGDDGDPF